MTSKSDRAPARRYGASGILAASHELLTEGIIAPDHKTPIKAASPGEPALPPKPALMSITDSCAYLGGIGRSTFYADILPLLETVRFGGRNLVVVQSMDELVAARRQRAV